MVRQANMTRDFPVIAGKFVAHAFRDGIAYDAILKIEKIVGAADMKSPLIKKLAASMRSYRPGKDEPHYIACQVEEVYSALCPGVY